MNESIPGVHSDPEILGGTPVFVGTRVPVRVMLDYLEHDRPLADQGVQHQQTMTGLRIGVVVMVAPSSDIEDLRPLVAEVIEALEHLQPGQIQRVGG